ncbi:type II toxin-antitoxin system HicB family antitoxin [Corynebacterium sanguinis]|uniref:Type II toxin-antitoxin system HicB family antitoxin n=1 Tax=Corynebacterium sanguinis TaxID=2594913 RepID=A0A838WPL2_9CORY|nr:type II toxin-antitoxin system HicB family antitoxin [Corynebacterium sanguinis]MBA4505046.1 type II toxin-antitoxin system HicB family antitoxin [Corynebacterium sanguinis]
MDINKYTYQISWSEEDQEYVAAVAEFPSLSWLAPDRQEAEAGLVELVAEVIEDMESSGEEIPEPLGSRSYSGRFNVRTSPSLHRKLVIAAKTEGVSLNTLINQKLASV